MEESRIQTSSTADKGQQVQQKATKATASTETWNVLDIVEERSYEDS